MADKLVIELVLRPSKNKKSFDAIERQAKQSGKKAGDGFKSGFGREVSTNLKDIAKNAIGVGLALKGISTALRTVGQGFSDLRIFSRGIAEINSILPVNQKLTEGATQRLIDFSSQFGASQQGEARAFYNIVSAGVKGTSKQLRTLAIANKAAVAGIVDIDSATRVLVSSVNAYSKSGLTAQKASDVLFIAVREGITTFRELSEFLGNTTSIAQNAGVEFTELAGAIAFITKSGIRTDLAVTGLRQVFAAVIAPTREAADEAKRLGLEFNKAAIESKGLAGFLKDVQVKTKGNEKSLSTLFGNIRALAPILNIVNGNFEDFSRILKETRNSAGATGAAFGIISKNLDFKLDKASAEFRALGLNLFRIVEPALKGVANQMVRVLRLLNSPFSRKPVTELDKVAEASRRVNKDIANITEQLNKARAFPQKTLFGGLSNSGRAVLSLTADLEKLQLKRSDLRDQQKKLLVERQRLNQVEVQGEVNKAEKIRQINSEALRNIASLGLTNLERLEFERDKKLTILRQELEGKEGLEGEFISRKAVIDGEFLAKEQEISSQRIFNAKATTKGVSASFTALAKNAKITSGQIASTVNNVMAKGIGNGFTAIGKSLRDGTNGIIAFEAIMEQTFGNLASSLGDFYIAKGIALSADPTTPGSGAGLIAAGSALKVLGGYLGSAGGGRPGEGGGSSGSGGAESIGGSDTFALQEESQFEEKTSVSLTVQGSIFNTSETARDLLDLLNDNFDNTGSSITGARFA